MNKTEAFDAAAVANMGFVGMPDGSDSSYGKRRLSLARVARTAADL